VKRVIADITKANPGTEERLFESLSRSVAGASHDVTVICFDSQSDRVRSSHPAFKIKSLQYGTHYTLIASIVKDLLLEMGAILSDEDSVMVLSFHREVLTLGLEFQAQLKVPSEFQSWSTLWKGLGSPTLTHAYLPAQAFRWPVTLMTMQEALRVLLSALRKSGAIDLSTATRQAELRYLLAANDPRFSKQNPAASVPGLIAHLVKAAEERNLIELDRSDIVNPHLWLRGGSASSVDERPSRISEQEKKSSRSEELINMLKAIDLGPFSVIRPYLYDALAEVMGGGPNTVRFVLAQSVELTRTKCNDANLRTNNYPWRKVRQFLINLMTRCPVLLDSAGQTVIPSFLTLSREVVALRQNWKEELEGELIIALVEAGAEIQLIDIPLLAGALYFSRQSEDEERVDTIISYLIQKGTLAESATVPRRLVLVETKPISHTGDYLQTDVLPDQSAVEESKLTPADAESVQMAS